ncbi:MAG: bifunctional tetrahydrofolate synthase/dihydrofolate synthase [Gammaproteobacteria bacterium]|nr:bifunctional tetrahydrofolate synthase/dihydrofolate synthase [Gammaproteobacteria bacterium]MCP5201625.1 bifunctional tetrahydrofolate synthase/dihydrofolate synthase [Gammaproteobacteria bacterium]
MAASGQDVLVDLPEPAPGAEAPLASWLGWLERGRGDHIDLGLERSREVAARLGLQRPAPVVVTVAGTNGKGSSVALLEAVWRAAGYRVGAYTSPHLIRYNERIRIDGSAVRDEPIRDAFAAVEAARGDVSLTYFEFATLAALSLFERATLDVVILEVGLGGRLDAVNIVDADVALIAAIGLDHEDWLGSTREAIALEKAGIMRAGRPVVCSDHVAPATLVEHAATLGAELHLIGADFAFERSAAGWNWWNARRLLEALPHPALDGLHQYRNAAGALATIECLADRLPVDEAAIRSGLAGVVLHGRFERLAGDHEYVMDVAHNPQAAAIFAATLATAPCSGRTHALVGMLRTKNHREYLRALLGHVDCWHFTDLPGANGARATELADCLASLDPRLGATCHPAVAQAHATIVAGAVPGDRVLVLGSFLTVGAMMGLLERQGPA